MIEIVSIKFKNRGKCYFFAPGSLKLNSGDKVVVETSKGLELAECSSGNHMVPDNAVVQPLRPVVRLATADDLRVAEVNKQREREAYDICQKKIEEHGLDMKLVDVECNFEGNKTMFFFTSDGRVDFRELVKDLAGIFRNRIELRQIGVRDEAKMIGGIGICGRPYCCSQFLDDFQPVSTKMAKVQSLSLNPTKISGSCGRLMCCLRYEQEAYEELIKKVPKQGAFVETKDGYGTAIQVNLLRQTVKVKLDHDGDDSLRSYKAGELCAVPGGRPKDGETPPSVLHYVPPEPEEEEAVEPESDWTSAAVVEPKRLDETADTEFRGERKSGNKRRRRSRGKSGGEAKAQGGDARIQSGAVRQEKSAQPKGGQPKKKPQPDKVSVKPVKIEKKPDGAEKAPASEEAPAKKSNNRRRRYYRGNKPKTGGQQQ